MDEMQPYKELILSRGQLHNAMPVENLVVEVLAHILKKARKPTDEWGVSQSYLRFDTLDRLCHLSRPFIRRDKS